VEQRVVLDNVAFTRVGKLLVTCFGTSDPTDDEIEKFCERLAMRDYEAMLYSARGAGPNSKQRARITKFWKEAGGAVPRTAVLTDSAPARWVTQAFSWLLNVDTKCFASSELPQALSYLGPVAVLADVAGTDKALHSAIEQKLKQRRTG
jgi:hypothetical protein